MLVKPSLVVVTPPVVPLASLLVAAPLVVTLDVSCQGVRAALAAMPAVVSPVEMVHFVAVLDVGAALVTFIFGGGLRIVVLVAPVTAAVLMTTPVRDSQVVGALLMKLLTVSVKAAAVAPPMVQLVAPVGEAPPVAPLAASSQVLVLTVGILRPICSHKSLEDALGDPVRVATRGGTRVVVVSVLPPARTVVAYVLALLDLSMVVARLAVLLAGHLQAPVVVVPERLMGCLGESLVAPLVAPQVVVLLGLRAAALLVTPVSALTLDVAQGTRTSRARSDDLVGAALSLGQGHVLRTTQLAEVHTSTRASRRWRCRQHPCPSRVLRAAHWIWPSPLRPCLLAQRFMICFMKAKSSLTGSSTLSANW